jgi:hypothetical protein
MREIVTRAHYDAGERALTFERIQDVGDIIERNKRLQSEPQRSDWGRHIASIPNIFLEQWLNEEWRRGNRSIRLFSEDFNKLVARKLRDPDWRFLRTDK